MDVLAERRLQFAESGDAAAWLLETVPCAAIPRLVLALRRLAQLARTDQREWAATVRSLWPRDGPRWLRRGSTTIRLLIHIMWGFSADSLPDEWLEGGAEDADLPCLPVCFRICSSVNVLYRALRRLHAIAAHAQRSTRRVMLIHSVRVLSPQIDLRSLDRISELAQCGVEITEMQHVLIRVEAYNAVSFLTSLQKLVPTYYRGPDAVASTAIRNVVIVPTANRAMSDTLEKVVSAIGESRSAHDVVMVFYSLENNDQSDHFVRQMAFSLFSRGARHRLQRIVMDGPIHCTQLVQSFVDVILAQDPLVELFLAHEASIKTHELTRISASRFFLFDPIVDNNDVVVATQRHHRLRVITQSPQWWSVYLPGWGQAWVKPEDALTQYLDKPELREPPSILELVVRMDGRDFVNPFAWLKIVAAHVQQLTLSVHHGYNPRPETLWRTVREAFPHLKTLRLGCILADSLQSLIDECVTSNWTLEGLVLEGEFLLNRNRQAEFVLLLDALSDHKHPMARTLRKLSIETLRGDQSHDELLEAASRMLSTNWSLRFLSISVPSTVDTTLVEAVCEHNGRAICEQLAPLGHREKCAFVSVISELNSPLDSCTLALIFRFSALCKQRVVEIDLFDV